MKPAIRLPATSALLLALALLPMTPALAGPGFDCAKATRQIDKAICAWDTVGALDGRMAAAYKNTLARQTDDTARNAVRSGQKAWLAERDRRCALNTVKPRPDSEEGLSPQQFGQLICLQTMYPPRIVQLMDLAAPPLVPLHIKTVPVAPLQKAYPDDWQQAGYQVQFSPDNSLMALGVEDDAGYVKQVWLYQPASGRLSIASPHTHQGKIEKPADIADVNLWLWGDDGRFYVRARRPLGTNSLFVADLKGYAESRNPPDDIVRQLAAYDAARQAPPASGAASAPGLDDDSHNEQEGGAFVAWAQNKGHGSFDLMIARRSDQAPRVIASGGAELMDFLLDPAGRRLFHSGDDGILVTDPGTGSARRLKGTHGMSLETRPLNLSSDGAILAYAASGSCTQDAADELDPEADDDSDKRVCLAYLPPAIGTAASTATAAPNDNPWIGRWSGTGEGELSATIRRNASRPDDSELRVDLQTGTTGCAGAITLYGKPRGNTLVGESRETDIPDAPVCRIEMSLTDKNTLKTEVAGPCTDYHGAACGFDGTLLRSP